ncbi:pseudouridine-5'-phosphate glycosidase [Agrococcus sp. SGAir0287]|uniref:pseudouridine-5'-phosphate glycosidase n=1 Tax=Agrococcus sp. SGAir0287 TaxID=2070347 RepID=UPI0010CCBD76|nr:pseudouridine-5'-phosphate glycosidase [Agrococcus sp. SGAir0287]QCR18456.1 pseudouridine-5-phosphate glycosidase [Agrococcus sp. SGAir0287]
MHVAEEVRDALDAGIPVVALESTIISHGLPRPRNLEAAREFEAIVRDAGAVPATIAVVDGVPRVGLDEDALERIAGEGVAKASVRDLPILAARRGTGATTVAGTVAIAARAGIRVFATGGLGGVHPGASSTFDESADIPTLARHPVAVVCAGVKSVLDVGATLERMETLSVPVVGWRTDRFPMFWLSSSPHALDWRVDAVDEIAAILRDQDATGAGSGLVVANPLPIEQQWDPAEHDAVVAQATAEAERDGIHGKAVTPYLLGRIVELSEGRSLEVNLALVRSNIRLAAAIATAYAGA